MARLIPSNLNIAQSNYGEYKVYKLLRDADLADDFVIMHSLNMIVHNSKREGEADFVIVGPLGILDIEVKGANGLSVNNGKWTYKNFNRSYTSNESPFKQAKYNLYSLAKSVTENINLAIDIKRISGYGVIFPNITFDISSIEWSKEMVLDLNNLDKFSDFIFELFYYWRNKSNIPSQLILSKDNIKKIVDYLRPNFEKVESVKRFIARNSILIDRFTEEQFQVLDGLSYQNRILINGLAGTGKTLLAVEQAKRMSTQHERVIFLCFNKLLMQNIYVQLLNYNNIDVCNIDKLIYRIMGKNNLEINSSDIASSIKYINDNINSIHLQSYDYVIIDEGQDILTNKYFSTINNLIKGGFENGNWTIFYDDSVQYKIFGQLGELKEIIGRLESFSVKYFLTINCRNSEFLGKKVNELTHLPIPKKYKILGDENNFEVHFINSKNVENLLLKKINELLISGIKPNSITILTTSKKFETIDKIYSNLRPRIKTFINLTKYSKNIEKEKCFYIPEKCISYSTTHAFKGLENDVIIILDEFFLNDAGFNELLYIGMTRAKAKAILLLNEERNN